MEFHVSYFKSWKMMLWKCCSQHASKCGKEMLSICVKFLFPTHLEIVFFNGFWASLVAQRLRRLPPMRETWVWSLGREDPQEKEMATHISPLAWKIRWMEEPGRLQSVGLQRVGHDWATSLHFILPRSKRLLISWLQSPSVLILEPKKTKSDSFHIFPICLPWSDRTGYYDLSFLNVEF